MSIKRNIIYLSHFMNNDTPLYGNGDGISFSSNRDIELGDSCNTMDFSFPNHSGTHIDFPSHFNPTGKNLNNYDADYWEFNEIELIDLSGQINDCEMIKEDHFIYYNNLDADILLIKTGYGKYRGIDRYTLTPPGISSKLSGFLRDRYKNLRCIGMDLISTSSFSNREEGHRAHHAFLNPKSGQPILLIEDMKLDLIYNFNKIIVSPLLVDNADGSPCTILAFYDS